MLKEIYLLRDGIHIFHYPTSLEHNEDHYILSSGFLSALQSFAQETRSSAIDFFASKDEIFIYDTLSKAKLVLVCIFENNIQQSVAREIIKNVKAEMNYAKINKLKSHQIPEKSVANKLSKKITEISKSLVSIDYQILAAKEIFEQVTDLSFLLLYDYSKNIIHYFDSISQKLKDVEIQSNHLKSMQKNILKLIKGLSIGNNYRFVVIQGTTFVLVMTKYRTVLNVGYSSNPTSTEEIFDIPFQIMSFPTYTNYHQHFYDLALQSRWRLGKIDKIFTVKGQPAYWNTPELVKNLFSPINDLLKTFGDDTFDEIQIYVENPEYALLRITTNFTQGEHTIDFHSNRK